jgi:CarD family transcriptional regulator
MNEYDDVEWAKVIKSVYLRMTEKRYDEFEPDYMEKAKNFLYGEIAFRFRLPFEYFVLREPSIFI